MLILPGLTFCMVLLDFRQRKPFLETWGSRTIQIGNPTRESVKELMAHFLSSCMVVCLGAVFAFIGYRLGAARIGVLCRDMLLRLGLSVDDWQSVAICSAALGAIAGLIAEVHPYRRKVRTY